MPSLHSLVLGAWEAKCATFLTVFRSLGGLFVPHSSLFLGAWEPKCATLLTP